MLLMSYQNRVDSGVLSASAAVSGLPVDNLTDSVIANPWRVAATMAWAEVDFGADVEIGVLALVFPRDTSYPVGASDTIRHRLGTTLGGGDVLDTGASATGIAEGYGVHVRILDTPATARFWRFDIAAPSLASQGFIEVGRAWAGPSWKPDYNIEAGRYSTVWADAASVAEAEKSGARYVGLGARRRVIEFSLGLLDPADRDTAEDIQRLAGRGNQILAIPEPDRWARSAVLGTLPAVQPISHRADEYYRTASRIEESL